MPLKGLNESTSLVSPMVNVGAVAVAVAVVGVAVVGAVVVSALAGPVAPQSPAASRSAATPVPAAAVDNRGRMRIMDGSLGGPWAQVMELVAPQ